MNILPITFTSTGAKTGVGYAGSGFSPEGLDLPIKSDATDQGKSGHLGFRPEDMSLADEDGALKGSVSLVESLGEVTNLYISIDGVDEPIVTKVPGTLTLKRGDTVNLNFDQSKMYLFDENGHSLLYR